MALKVWDGFDHYASQVDLQSRVGVLQWGDISANSVTFVTGRGGYGFCAYIQPAEGGSIFGGSFNHNYASGVVGQALDVTPISGNAYLDFMLMDYVAGAPQITLRVFLVSGTVIAYLGDPNIGTPSVITSSPPNACNPYVWQRYELKGVISTVGSFDFHVNGSSVLSASGVTTQSTDNAWFNGSRLRAGFVGGLGGPDIYVDDYTFNDLTTGPGTYPCNNFLGDVAVRTLKTTANSSVQWTPLANQNWQEVGETQFDGDASYNYATTVGNADLFTFASLPTTTSVVFGVQVTGAYRKLDASAQTIKQNIKSGTTESSGATLSLSLNYCYYTDPFVLDPNTSATWAPTAVNAALGGYTLNS